MLPGAKPSSDDLAALENFLSDPSWEGEVLTYRQVLGFFFALACAPEMAPPSEWIQFVLGEDDPEFEDERQVAEVMGALMGLYNEVNAGVLERDVSLPRECAFRDDLMSNLEPGAPIGEWCEGFRAGHVWLEESWERYLVGDMEDELSACLLTLVFFSSRKIAEEIAADGGGADRTVEDAAATFRRLFEGAMRSYAHMGRSIFEALYEAEEEGRLAPEPHVAPEPIGRNDPCRCGSGKKFKKCCGRNVH
jgi:uncharacterized protein